MNLTLISLVFSPKRQCFYGSIVNYYNLITNKYLALFLYCTKLWHPTGCSVLRVLSLIDVCMYTQLEMPPPEWYTFFLSEMYPSEWYTFYLMNNMWFSMLLNNWEFINTLSNNQNLSATSQWIVWVCLTIFLRLGFKGLIYSV